MTSYQLNGTVINAKSKQGYGALRIEAWGKPVKAAKKLATATLGGTGVCTSSHTFGNSGMLEWKLQQQTLWTR